MAGASLLSKVLLFLHVLLFAPHTDSTEMKGRIISTLLLLLHLFHSLSRPLYIRSLQLNCVSYSDEAVVLKNIWSVVL